MVAPPAAGEFVRVWLTVAAQSFGGPAAQVAVMHKVVVVEKGWVGEQRYLRALNYCMLLPGPEAQQLATYLGWLLHGVRGGLLAGGLFILPGAVSLGVLSVLYVLGRDVPVVAAALAGVQAVVLALVVEAVMRLKKRALTGNVELGLAASSFAALVVFGAPFPLVVVAAAAFGALRPRSTALVVGADDALIDRLLAQAPLDRLRPRGGPTIATAAVWLLIWLGPIGALALALGPEALFTRLGVFFAQAAVVTFGGAYALLAWVAQHAVADQGWLSTGEMLDGLAMAETTPGPLIQIVQFVGFLAAWREPGALNPWAAAGLGSLITVWVTFAPSFLWVFVGAPWMERVSGQPRLQGALRGVTAAVVGVIAHLALWSAVHVWFREVPVAEGWVRVPMPVWSSVDVISVALALVATVAALRFHASMFRLVGGGAVAGVLAWAAVGWVG